MKRYAVDRSTLVESSDGAVVMAADLPVEALESFRPAVAGRIYRYDGHIAMYFTESEYNALRDLLLSVKP